MQVISVYKHHLLGTVRCDCGVASADTAEDDMLLRVAGQAKFITVLLIYSI